MLTTSISMRNFRAQSAKSMPPSALPRIQPPHLRLLSTTTKKLPLSPPHATSSSSSVTDSDPPQERIIEEELSEEARVSYLSYAMSTLLGRAIPDARDGLKPVHRRILFAMKELGLDPNKPYRKSARVVGEVLGKLHPHGDKAVYDALVRLAQDFSMRLPLVDGQGNFGSVDDDPAAAMRYTECKLTRFASESLLADLDQETVDTAPNFDASFLEPTVLPAKVPLLLVNGAQGIAVGLVSNIPPHNLGDVVAAMNCLIAGKKAGSDVSDEELAACIKGPDFPTGGEVIDLDTLPSLYKTGKGIITLRGKMHVEGGEDDTATAPPPPPAASSSSSTKPKRRASASSRSKSSTVPIVVITEIPYQVWKSDLVRQIASLIDDNRLEGVKEVRDESDREIGVRVVLDLRPGADAALVQRQLYRLTRLQVSVSCRFVAVSDGVPKQMSLRNMLHDFVEFRSVVIEKRTKFDLKRAKDRAILVDGLLIAQSHMDAIVKLLREAKDDAEAVHVLSSQFQLLDVQIQAVLSMPLRRLIRLERSRLESERADLAQRIETLETILSNRNNILDVVLREAKEVADAHTTPRRARLVEEESSRIKDGQVLIMPNRPSLVFLSRTGYIKRLPPDTFSTQGRGGRGKSGAKLPEGDEVGELIHTMSHDVLIFLTQQGRAYSMRALHVPEMSRTARGQLVANLLPRMRPGEEVTACFSIPSDLSLTSSSLSTTASPGGILATHAASQVLLLTRGGLLKKLNLSELSNLQSTGKRVIALDQGDSLLSARLCNDARDALVMASSAGRALVVPLEDGALRTMGCQARGVLSMRLKQGDELIGLDVIPGVNAATLQLPTNDIVDVDTTSSSSSSSLLPHEEEEATPSSVDDEDELLASASSDEIKGPWLLCISRLGYGKRVPVSLFRAASRRGLGVRCARVAEGDSLREVSVVGAMSEGQGESGSGGMDVLLVSAKGVVCRVPLDAVPIHGRTSRGVRLIKLGVDDAVKSATVLEREEVDEQQSQGV